ncbi:MAG: rod shape-determining protein MreD [Gammaproteobacteria bacterium]|nr:rod shape-determining protein MreD [Gammaproteobacteria bacterium]
MALAAARLPFDAPDWLGWCRPDWVLAVFFFWAVATPDRVGIVSAWIAGLFVDAIIGTPLGLSGFCLALATYLAKRFNGRLVMFSLLQRTLAVLVLAEAVQLIHRSVLTFIHGVDWLTPALFGPALATAVVYPAISLGFVALTVRYPVR